MSKCFSSKALPALPRSCRNASTLSRANGDGKLRLFYQRLTVGKAMLKRAASTCCESPSRYPWLTHNYEKCFPVTVP